MTFDPSTLLLAAAVFPVAVTALLLDRLFGYPDGLQEWIGHPVEWIGAVIARLDRSLNRGAARKPRGVLALVIVMALALAATVPLTLALRSHESGWIIEALLAGSLLSQKSLEDHVRAVADGLERGVAAGRVAVGRIVGRDTRALDRSGVAKAAIESLAENMSDGVLAPLFWLLVAGLPGAALYKAINTADSMIGHLSKTYRGFGWAAARADDLANLIPSRATGWLIVLAASLSPGASGRSALRIMARDAPGHVSPNAGWPEAALAGALNVRLGGPRSYQGRKVDLAWMGDGRAKLELQDIERGLGLYATILNIVTAIAALACLMMWMA